MFQHGLNTQLRATCFIVAGGNHLRQGARRQRRCAQVVLPLPTYVQRQRFYGVRAGLHAEEMTARLLEHDVVERQDHPGLWGDLVVGSELHFGVALDRYDQGPIRPDQVGANGLFAGVSRAPFEYQDNGEPFLRRRAERLLQRRKRLFV